MHLFCFSPSQTLLWFLRECMQMCMEYTEFPLPRDIRCSFWFLSLFSYSAFCVFLIFFFFLFSVLPSKHNSNEGKVWIQIWKMPYCTSSVWSFSTIPLNVLLYVPVCQGKVLLTEWYLCSFLSIVCSGSVLARKSNRHDFKSTSTRNEKARRVD